MLRLRGLALLLRRNRLRKVLLKQRLECQHHDKCQQENQHQPFLAAGFVLWILNVWQSYGFLTGAPLLAAFARSGTFHSPSSSPPDRIPHAQKDDIAAPATKPSGLRAPRHAAPQLPSRIPSRWERNGTLAGKAARQPTYNLAAAEA